MRALMNIQQLAKFCVCLLASKCTVRMSGRNRQGRRKSKVLLGNQSASTHSLFYILFSLPGCRFYPGSLSSCRISSVFLPGAEGNGTLAGKAFMVLSNRGGLALMSPAARCAALLAFIASSLALYSPCPDVS